MILYCSREVTLAPVPPRTIALKITLKFFKSILILIKKPSFFQKDFTPNNQAQRGVDFTIAQKWHSY